MISLVFAAPECARLRQALNHPHLESAAILLCVPMRLNGVGGWRLIVHEVHVATEESYVERTSMSVHLSSAFCLPIEKRAARNGWSVVYVHTHPSEAAAEFSAIDDGSEATLAGYIGGRIPGVPHAALLFSRNATRARVLGGADPVVVVEVGAQRQVNFDPSEPALLDDRFDRQVRAFGREGQDRLGSLTVGVVGLGGTGSLVVQQLAHLGVSRYILVDDDTIEASNLNRVVGAEPGDVGSLKVDVAERQILRLQPLAHVEKLAADVTSCGTARRVVESDDVFSCTDTHASRHILNQAAYQYLTPVIDMGVSITVDANHLAVMSGHAKMLAPGLSCLWCARHLNAGRLREELMTDEQRRLDPYVQGQARVEQPAVISLNGIVASASMTMLLSAVAGVPSQARYLFYDGNRGRMNAIDNKCDRACSFCGSTSTAGWGDTYPLPERRNA